MLRSLIVLSLVTFSFFIVGCSEDEVPTGGSNIVPITSDLFPLTVGNKLTYSGYATYPGSGGTVIPDPMGSYRTVWTIAANAVPVPLPGPLGNTANAIIDSTTGPFGPGGFVVTVSRTLLVQKDSSGDFYFLQTIGPFKRASGILVGSSAADTLIWVAVARPSQGVGSTGAVWTAYDATFTDTSNISVRLEIFGQIEAIETIEDSTSMSDGPVIQRETYRSRTWRRITRGTTIVQDDATTSQLWLEEDLGPAQMNIAEDPENPGHWRVLTGKNF